MDNVNTYCKATELIYVLFLINLTTHFRVKSEKSKSLNFKNYRQGYGTERF